MTLSNELKEIIETDSAVYALSIDSDRTTATAFADGAEYALINKAVYEAAGLVKKEEWIDVNDRLPQPNERIVVYEPSSIPSYPGDINIVNYRKYRAVDKRYSFCDEQDEQPGLVYPTHWQPLPAPPSQLKK